MRAPRWLHLLVLALVVAGLCLFVFAGCGALGIGGAGDAPVNKTEATAWGLAAATVAALVTQGIGLLTGIISGAGTFLGGLFFSTRAVHTGPPPPTPWGTYVILAIVGYLLVRFRSRIFGARMPRALKALDHTVRAVVGKATSINQERQP